MVLSFRVRGGGVPRPLDRANASRPTLYPPPSGSKGAAPRGKNKTGEGRYDPPRFPAAVGARAPFTIPLRRAPRAAALLRGDAGGEHRRHQGDPRLLPGPDGDALGGGQRLAVADDLGLQRVRELLPRRQRRGGEEPV